MKRLAGAILFLGLGSLLWAGAIPTSSYVVDVNSVPGQILITWVPATVIIGTVTDVIGSVGPTTAYGFAALCGGVDHNRNKFFVEVPVWMIPSGGHFTATIVTTSNTYTLADIVVPAPPPTPIPTPTPPGLTPTSSPTPSPTPTAVS